MTGSEQREAARQFINRWRGKGKEDEDGRSYWIELLSNVFGVENVTERIDFEKKVVVDGNTKRIDVYIPETRVIIEQKSLNVPLNKKIRNSGDIDLTPFEQADRYNSKLIFDERARWIVTCNFAEIWIYDMNEKQPEPTKIMLEELQTKYPLLDFLVEKEVQKISHEMEVSIQAGDIVGLIYNAFLEQYKIPEEKKNETAVEKAKREHKLKSLNALCVRLVFCLYAEDAGIFGEKRNMFHDYLARYEARDCRRALIELFKVLDTEDDDREDYLEEDLAQFPYVNGGLFADETIEIPQFTEEIRELLLVKASEEFNWRDISPTIFGAVFESTLNPETRRSGGMHYTSIENIHKVIDPLFLNNLEEEFNMRDAWKFLLNTISETVTFEYWCKLNDYIARNEALEWGKLRTGNVEISGTDYVPPIPEKEKVIAGLEDIVSDKDITATEKALEIFVWGTKGQFFWDGNKRTSLMLANKILISAGAGIMTITDKYMEQFNVSLLEYYNTGKSDKLKRFLYDNAIRHTW